MKHSLLAITLLLTSNVLGQTTMEEFNYVTKGIEVAINSGLDMKDGYELRNVGLTAYDKAGEALFKNLSFKLNRGDKVAFHILMRNDNTVASYIVTNSGTLGKNQFSQVLCIPTGDSDENIKQLAKQQFIIDHPYKSQTAESVYWTLIELMIPYLDMVEWTTVDYEKWIEFE